MVCITYAYVFTMFSVTGFPQHGVASVVFAGPPHADDVVDALAVRLGQDRDQIFNFLLRCLWSSPEDLNYRLDNTIDGRVFICEQKLFFCIERCPLRFGAQ